jgi:hypothetical protein
VLHLLYLLIVGSVLHHLHHGLRAPFHLQLFLHLGRALHLLIQFPHHGWAYPFQHLLSLALAVLLFLPLGMVLHVPVPHFLHHD